MSNLKYIEIHGFEPIVFSDTRFLIIGSTPGEESLKTGEYYKGNNIFWDVIGKKANRNITDDEYICKKDALERTKIGLWDVYKTCYRKEGSSKDKDIKTKDYPYEYNNISELIKKYPSIKKIIFNGKGLYKKYYKKLNIPLTVKIEEEGSTSRLNTSCGTDNVRIAAWLKHFE